MDRNPDRHCSIPGIPYLRDWVESMFGDICEEHDIAYADGKCRICRDIKFIGRAAGRCLPFIGMFLFLPILFVLFQINTLINIGGVWWKR